MDRELGTFANAVAPGMGSATGAIASALAVRFLPDPNHLITFGSKDELVRAYLQTRRASVTQRITQAVERYGTPRERLLAVFEGQGELFAQPDYRGCAFARASAESHPGDLVEQAAEAYRRWVRALLTELAAQAGVPEPEVLARQLHLLYHGSGQSARMNHDPAAAAAARAAGATLLDAALARGTAAR